MSPNRSPKGGTFLLEADVASRFEKSPLGAGPALVATAVSLLVSSGSALQNKTFL
jgi:hypothetical protein